MFGEGHDAKPGLAALRRWSGLARGSKDAGSGTSLAKALSTRGRAQPRFEAIQLIPHDLRTSDPSFWTEIRDGFLGIGGVSVELKGRSPFKVDLPNPEVVNALHGFGWLNDLKRFDPDETSPTVQSWFDDWCELAGSPELLEEVWQTDLVARRVISWLSHAGLLLHNVSPDTHGRLLEQLEAHLLFLTKVRTHKSGHVSDSLLPAIALVLLDLCMDEPSRQASDNLEFLERALDGLFGPDGMPLSRNVSDTVAALVDLLPLRQCFTAHRQDIPKWYLEKIRAQLSALRTMRHGNGDVARFNGVGLMPPDALAAISAYDVWASESERISQLGDYVRIDAQDLVLLMDTGSAPADALLASRAHAGCLSFELSVGSTPFLCNCGRPDSDDVNERLRCRGTAAHSTLVLGGESSAQLIRPAEALRQGIEPSLSGPPRVKSNLRQRIGASELAASHDGYVAGYGRLHNRAFKVRADGSRVDGQDSLRSVGDNVRAPNGLEFALHFHLHPSVTISRTAHADIVICRLADGTRWQFKADGNPISLEETRVHLSSWQGDASTQIVVRKPLADGDSVDWSFQRVEV